MPYQAPVTVQQSTTWTVTAMHGQVSVLVQITAEGAATEQDGDSTLQDLVDVLSRAAGFSEVSGIKSYASSETRAMQPSS